MTQTIIKFLQTFDFYEYNLQILTPNADRFIMSKQCIAMQPIDEYVAQCLLRSLALKTSEDRHTVGGLFEPFLLLGANIWNIACTWV